jgi:starch phosphorylase
MARLTPQFSAGRAIREYVEEHYIPAALAYKNRSASNSKLGSTFLAWQQNIEEHWATLRFGNLTTQASAEQTLLNIEVYPGALSSDDIQVELYANANSGCKRVRFGECQLDKAGSFAGMLTYSVRLDAGCQANELTARVVPKKTGLSLPLECSHILWQH